MNELIRSFQLFDTTFQVIYGSLETVKADALVSSDDIFLTMSGGVSASLRRAAGEALLNDVRKLSTPIPVGSVVVTTAGALPARYVFHAITLDFLNRPDAKNLLAQLVRRVMILGSVLQLETIAVPLLGAGTAKLPVRLVLDVILCAAVYDVTVHRSSVKNVSIVIKADKISPALQKTLDEFAGKMDDAVLLLHRLTALSAVQSAEADDSALNGALTIRITEIEQKVQRLFYVAGARDDDQLSFGTELDAQGLKKAVEAVNERIKELDKEIVAKREQIALARERVNILQKFKIQHQLVIDFVIEEKQWGKAIESYSESLDALLLERARQKELRQTLVVA